MKAFDSNIRAQMWASCGALVLAAAACSSDKRPAQQPSSVSVATVSAYDQRPSGAAANDREATVQVSRELRERCSVPEGAEEAPRFEYDESTLRTRGENILDSVARCLSQGALKDQTITIIGRTDPRGTPQYNEKLGTSRAIAAKNYLVQRGVAAERVRVVSRGEQGARGNDEATWALDRRVDLELGDLSVSAARGAPNATGETGASASPILEGTRMQIESSEARQDPHPDAASYATTAEGGKPTGASGSGETSGSESSSTSASGSAGGTRVGGTVQGSASGSVEAGSSPGNR